MWRKAWLGGEDAEDAWLTVSGEEKPKTRAGKDAECESVRERAEKLPAWAPVAAAARLCDLACSQALYLSPPIENTAQRFHFPPLLDGSVLFKQ